jgi:hypothetical protein
MALIRQAFLSLLLLLSAMYMSGQQKYSGDMQIAMVYYIGEDEKNYEKMVQEYSAMLFNVCNNDINKAYDVWSDLLQNLEVYADKNNADIKGVRLWLNVFWDKDGGIDYIVFYPKPNSKKMNYEYIKEVLTGFARFYQLPVKFKQKFSHYGSAAFPVISRSVTGPEK